MSDTIPALLLHAAERDADGVWLRTDDEQLTFEGAVGAVGWWRSGSPSPA